MPAFTFAPADGMSRYYPDRGVEFQPGEAADWDDPPDSHWVPTEAQPVTTEPVSVRSKKGGDGQ